MKDADDLRTSFFRMTIKLANDEQPCPKRSYAPLKGNKTEGTVFQANLNKTTKMEGECSFLIDRQKVLG
ncbi:MAG: hypothetical protein MUC97_01990 [Bernardetiaceae bacterium]|nr:hypothetical protein [Bernardetiaceae bacterium]